MKEIPGGKKRKATSALEYPNEAQDGEENQRWHQ